MHTLAQFVAFEIFAFAKKKQKKQKQNVMIKNSSKL